MHKNRSRTLILWLFTVLAFWFATSGRAHADEIIPWMTGAFNSYDGLSMSSISPDAQWMFSLSGNPVIPDPVWGWNCDEWGYYCDRQSLEYFTSGSVSGELDHWNGTDFIMVGTFAGSVTGGY